MIKIRTKVFLAFFFLSFSFMFFDHIQAVSCLKSDNTCVQLEDDAESDECEDGTFYDDSEVCGSCWIDNQCDVEDYGQSSCLAQNGLWANTTDCDGREAAALQGQTDLTNVSPSINCSFPVSSNTQYTSLNNFGSAQDGGSSCHPGVDVNLTSGNQEIIAATAGVVHRTISNYATCQAGDYGVGGQASALIVEDDGIFFLYGGLDPNSFSLQSGDQISAGQLLGTSKNCGQLHFEVRSDADFSQFWYPPSGQTVGVAANYCRQNYSGTKPINLMDPTNILTNFSQGNCLVVANDASNYSAGDGFINPADELAFVKNNVFTVKKYDLNKFIAHLVYDGNQAYCAASSASVISGFTHSKYKSMKLDLKYATVPLIRNNNYQPARRNSAETYYGYIADTQNKNITSDADLLTESSWLGKTLTNETRCTMKVYNLLYLRTEYDTCLSETLQICLPTGQTIAKTAKQKKCVALGEERCEKAHLTMSSGFSTKELIQDLTDKKVALLPNLRLDTSATNQEGGESSYILDENGEEISAKIYCQNLAQSTVEQDQIIKDGFGKFPLYLNNLYRTGYIVQAIKICPVRKTGDCGNPVWDYDNCSWSIIPDRVRIYPFKFPDFATNKNYCDQTNIDYPEKCVINSNLPSFDPTTNYSDPATLNAQFLQTFAEQKKDRTDSVSARTQMISLAQNSTYESGDFVYCHNCKNTLSQALIKIINATNSNNTFNISYFGEKAGNMDCSEGITTGETSGQITTSALHSLKKEGVTAYEAPIAGSAGSFKESCCLERKTIIDENGIPQEICVSTAYAKAKVRYWIVSPQGEQLKMIEEQILGTFYQANKVTSTNSSNTSTSQSTTTTTSSTTSSIDYSSRSLTKDSYDGMQYWIYKPQANVSGLPLIVFLHGHGLTGTGNPGLTQLLANGANYPAVIISPQTKSNWMNNSVLTKVKKLIDQTVSKNSLNTSKISITGHSMGGRGVYHMVSAYPGFFSAAAPLSAINSQSDPMNLNYSSLAKLPLRSFTGRGESHAEQPRINKINEAGGKATLTALETVGHTETPAAVYPSNKTDLIQWLIDQSGGQADTPTPPSTTSPITDAAAGTYKAFISNDKRQNKYLSLQNITTKGNNAPNLNILGAGPITNIFIVQQSLYTKNSGLYQTLAEYKDINAYLTDVFNTGSGSIYTACGEITPISDPLHDAYLKSFLPAAYYNIMMKPVEELTDSMLEAACPSAPGRAYSYKAKAGKMVRYYDNGPLWSSKTKAPKYGNDSQLSRKKLEDCVYTIFDDPKLIINMIDCESFTIANNVGFGSNSHGCYASGLLQVKPFLETQMGSNYNQACSDQNNYPSLSSLSCNTQASIARLNLPLYNLAITKAIATNDGTRNEKFNSWACYWHVINGTSGRII